jgi:hypothetical protein
VIAATSSIIKEEHQTDTCIYCGGKLGEWKYKIIDGLEYKVAECENGHEARVRETCLLTIENFAKVHSMDWGNIKKTRY